MPQVRESVDGERLVRESLLMGVMRVACLLLALGAAACGPSEPLNVVAIQTGKSLNTDHSVGNHAASFRPKAYGSRPRATATARALELCSTVVAEL